MDKDASLGFEERRSQLPQPLSTDDSRVLLKAWWIQTHCAGVSTSRQESNCGLSVSLESMRLAMILARLATCMYTVLFLRLDATQTYLLFLPRSFEEDFSAALTIPPPLLKFQSSQKGVRGADLMRQIAAYSL